MSYPVTDEAIRRLRVQYENSPRWLQTIERTVVKGFRDGLLFGAAAALLAIYNGTYEPELIYGAFITTSWRTVRDVIPSVVMSLRGAVQSEP